MIARQVESTPSIRRSLRLVLVALLLFAPGCGGVNVRSDTSWSVLQRGHTYGTILGNGRAVDRAEGSAFGRAGQTLRLDYAFTPSNGSVSLGVWTTLTALDSNYWRTFEAPEQGRVEVPIPRTGFYTIRVSFWGFNGRYDVAWAVVSGLDVSTEAV